MLTIITPAESFDLTTQEVVKDELGYVGTGIDEAVRRAISQASAAIAAYCNRSFALETVSETIRLRSRDVSVLLSRFPVNDITSVHENGSALTTDDYELNAQRGLLTRISYDREWCWQAGKIVIVYSAGYELPHGLPDGIQRAAIDLCKLILKSPDPLLRSVDIPGVINRTIRDFPIGAVFPPEIEALLINHRLPAGS